MKLYFLRFCLLFLLVLSFMKCSDDIDDSDRSFVDDSASLALSTDGGGGNSIGGGNKEGQPEAGQITAGEWNDIENWEFWNNLIEKDTFGQYLDYWEFYPVDNGYNLQVVNQFDLPLIDAEVGISDGNQEIWQSKTDNNGAAQLWSDLFTSGSFGSGSPLLRINDNQVTQSLSNNTQPNLIRVNTTIEAPLTGADIVFVVDATGSMSDELEFLKSELADVISRVQSGNSSLKMRTGTVFYRDEGDEYVTRSSPLTDNPALTVNFIRNQRADGGGDWPEAVHSALVRANDMDWSSDARARIMFLLLDAPPHHTQEVIASVHSSIEEAASKGIKIIPIAASGIDVTTEFLLRFTAISTNGTYVFITDDSGIGNDHLEPTVGEYEVELMNDLLVRLIEEYTQ